MTPSRRRFCAAAAAVIALPAAAPPRDTIFADDFDELWTTLAARYCYFGDKATDWLRVRQLYRPRAVAAADGDAFAEVVRQVLAELYDAHTHLSDPADGTPRWPPYDLLVAADGGAAKVVAVRAASAAALAGINFGDRITAVDGVPVAEATARQLPRCLRRPDPAAAAHALNVALAGRRGTARRLTLISGDRPPRTVDLPLLAAPPLPDLGFERLDGGIGLITIRSFGDSATVAAFDAALVALREAPGLIIDVSDNGGGDTAVARPIMGRFITATKPYATMRRRSGAGLSAPWTEYVAPRGPFTYPAPVVVLAGPWSGSMAEGFPMGMKGIGRARVVGQPMMGLGAAVFGLRLDRTGIAAQYSAEPVYDIHGVARSRFQPDVPVAADGDRRAAGRAELARMIAAG